METSKKLIYSDVNLFSGSNDFLRTELGPYYHVVTTETDLATDSEVEYNYYTTDHIEALTDSSIVFNDISSTHTPASEVLLYEQINRKLMSSSMSDFFFNSIKIPFRIIGDTDKIVNDADWSARVLGGAYSTSSYKPLIKNNTIFNDHSFEYHAPYSMIEAKKLAAHSPSVSSHYSFDYYEIGYRYKEFLKAYESRIANEHTKLIPNIYMLKMVDDDASPELMYPKAILNFVSVENNEPQIINGDTSDTLFEESFYSYPPPYTVRLEEMYDRTENMYRDVRARMRAYLTGSYTNNAFNKETTSLVRETTSVVYHNSDFIDGYYHNFSEANPESDINKMPFYNMIRFPTESPKESYEVTIETGEGDATSAFVGARGGTTTHNQKTFTSIIKDNKLENEFLISLEKAFSPSTSTNLNYIQTTEFLTGSSTSGDLDTAKISKNRTIASRDCANILKTIYQNIQHPDGPRGTIMGPRTLDNASGKNLASRYRYYKTIKAFNAMEELKSMLDDALHTEKVREELPSLQSIMQFLALEKLPHETIAYRIRKVSGRSLGNQRQLDDTQDIYIMNNNSFVGNATYYDTQVKYGHDYQYRVYAYVVVPGYEYKYSDLRLSRQIGKVHTMDESGLPKISSQPEEYCLEFYDPATGIASEQLLNKETNLLGTDYVAIINENTIDLFKTLIAAGMTMSEIDVAKYSSYVNFTATEFLTPGFMGVAPTPDMLVSDYIEARAYTAFGLPALETVDIIINELYSMWAVNTVQYTDPVTGAEVILATPSANRFATNAQIKSENPYLADFYFHYLPSIKIVEIPIATNIVRVMDNPPVAADITPYQRKDNSQIIGFYINVESFRFSPYTTDTETDSKIGKYPTPLNGNEETKRAIYLSSNNMLPDEVIKNDSVSKIASLEVYRLDKRPTSLKDFNSSLVFTKDLSLKQNAEHKITNCFYEEKVQTNKKYYYLFRFLNEHGDAGYIAPIQVAELVDDGGYKYSLFDVIFENDLDLQDREQNEKSFKKLIEISPAIRHTTLDELNINYKESAASQLPHMVDLMGSETPTIWGKTFKFRITSKKTGRKIDFNIKYNLRGS